MKSSKSVARTIYLFKRVEMLIKSELEHALQDVGLTPGQYTTISLLGGQKEVSSAELARRMGVTAQSMSETITLLERKGLIVRQENPANRRILQIATTPRGIEMLARCEDRVETLEERLLGGIGADELRRLRAVLTRILDGARA